MDDNQVDRLRSYPEVESAVGVLVAAIDLDDEHPFFLELGMPPEELATFGVQVVAGRAYTADAQHEVMLGYRAANDLGKSVGDSITIDEVTFQIVGLFSTGQVFGDSASMLPLLALQGYQRKPGTVTLAFVQIKPGTDMEALRAKIEHDLPEVATVRTVSEFGRVDRNLSLISAANVGVSFMALVVGAIGVMSGCGKSTLLHLLAALDTPTSGSISVNGHDLRAHPDLDRYRRREIGLVFQLHNLLPHLTALQNVEIAMFSNGSRHPEQRLKAEQLLDDVGLSDKTRVKPPRLSGGERQRLAVARALANDPAILLADEPTGSLDTASVGNLLSLFARIREGHRLTILLVTHDLSVAGAAGRVIHMVDGRTVDGPPA